MSKLMKNPKLIHNKDNDTEGYNSTFPLKTETQQEVKGKPMCTV